MKKLVQNIILFFTTTLIGGITVILPAAVTIGVFSWIYHFISSIIRPISKNIFSKTQISLFIADLTVIILLIAVCFLLGLIIKTGIGKAMHLFIEEKFLAVIPGYKMVKETVGQFLGKKENPFNSVALVKVFDNDTMMTSFVTDEHPDGYITVFVPTGPNPTSGNIYHLKKENVYKVNISIEDAMRSIISVGAGASKMLDLYEKADKKEKK